MDRRALIRALVTILALGFILRPEFTLGQEPFCFQEPFEDTDFASRGWYDNLNLVLSEAESIPGSTHSAAFHFPIGAMTPTSGGAIRHLFSDSDEIYVSYHVKYSANWEGSNQPYHPHEFYMLTNQDGMWTGPAYTRMTTYIEQNEGQPLLSFQDSQNIDESNIGVDLTGITDQRGVAGCNGDSDGYGQGSCYWAGSAYRNGKDWRAGAVLFADSPGPYFKNDWHFIEAYFKLNTIVDGIGVPDGILRYWYDGQLIIEYTDVLLRTGEHPDMKFNQFLIGPYIGDGSPVDQTMWVDDLTLKHNRSTPLGDLNSDCTVDASDLAALLGAWGAGAGHPADLNGDNAVDATDLGILLGAWD